MKHLRKFNESKTNESYLYDDGDIHDSLLYNNGAAADLGTYYDIKHNLNVDVDELPDEAKALISEIDSIINEIRSELRPKILSLYNILTGDESFNEGRTEKASKEKDSDVKLEEFRSKVKEFLKGKDCKVKQIGDDFEVHFDEEHVAQVMFRKDKMTVKKEGSKFGKDFKYNQLGDVKKELTSLLK